MRRPFLFTLISNSLTLIVLSQFNLDVLIFRFFNLNFRRTTFLCFALLCFTLTSCKTRVHPTPAPTPIQSHAAASVIEIGITTHLGDQQRFIRGDDISFLVNLNKDAYLLILYQDADHHLWQLVPNDFNPYNFFKAGDYLTIPNESLPYKFIAAPPFGKETLFAFASDHPFPSFNYSLTQNGMILINATIESIFTTLHDIARKGQYAIGEAKLVITTQDQLL